MSTRCAVALVDQYTTVLFYRHSDGYPDGVQASLDRFCDLIEKQRIRNNVSQAGGWLVIIGNQEYEVGPEPGHDLNISGWKVGAYEPIDHFPWDLEWLHIVDVHNATWRSVEIYRGDGKWDKDITDWAQAEIESSRPPKDTVA